MSDPSNEDGPKQVISGFAPIRPDHPNRIEGAVNIYPDNWPREDTTDMDHEMIANDLERVAKTAGRLGYPDMATEIGALVAKYRKPKDESQS